MTSTSIRRLPIIALLALAVAPIAERSGAWLLASAQRQEGRADDRESDLYRQGAEAIGEEDWETAVSRFDEVIELGGERTEGALHWKAFALHKLGRRGEALGAIAALRASYPRSRWLKEAGALEIEIQAAGGQAPRPEAQQDDDLKLLALSRLMESDPDRAMPLVERFLSGEGSPRLKEHAIFVLAQSRSPKAAVLLGRIARGQIHPELQTKALHDLGARGSGEALETLSEIYASSQSLGIKKTILEAFAIAGATDRLLAVVLQEKSYNDLVEAAIHGLGVAGGRAELRRLYKELPSDEAKADVLHAAGVIAADRGFLHEVLRSEKVPRLRLEAIRALGITGGQDVAPRLIEVYKIENDGETRLAVIEALFTSNNAAALVALARKESDPQLKREIVQKLSVMRSPEATEYMLEILEQ